MKTPIATLLLFTALVASACSRERAPTPEQAAPAAEEQPVEGGTLVRRLESDVATLNFALTTTDYEKQVLSYLHDALIELDSEMNLVPGLAGRWEISDDGKAYTFHLNPAARYSDGRPVTAGDVVFTLRKIVDPSSGSTQFSAMFEGLRSDQTVALDPQTVRVVFDEAHAARLYAFNIPVLPEHVYGKGNFRTDFNDQAVGSGPYRLARREAGKEIVLERRDDYWRTQPWIHRIVFKVIAEDAVAWNAMKRGDIDEMLISSDRWLYEGDDPQVRRVMEIHRYYDLAYNFIPWNNRDPLLSDKRVRTALSMAIDRSSMITDLYHGTARIITGPFTPDQWAYNPQVPAIRYDPQQARATLESLGWRDTDGDGTLDRDKKPFEIEMLIRMGNATAEKLAQILQDNLKPVGVRLKIRKVDDATFWDRIISGDFQASSLTWSLDLDPDPYSYFHSSQFPPNGQNFVFYASSEADRLMIAGRQELDLAARRDIYHRLHAVLAGDQPYAWIVQVSRKWAVNKRLRNVREAKGLGLFSWYPGPRDWWIPPGQRHHDRR
ncbi:MAG TPA: ABC transporter substrate-binding protein [Thermoanaerobaculia bacterium]|nr:ABC transporter substrate-binding protein [Thermoanaerobaculia bacterium]